jgi:hypothetical protein
MTEATTTLTRAEARTASIELKCSVDAVQETLTDMRIPVSLKRFDSWFGLFLRNQNMRWLVFDEALLPTVVGIVAMGLLARHLC